MSTVVSSRRGQGGLALRHQPIVRGPLGLVRFRFRSRVRVRVGARVRAKFRARVRVRYEGRCASMSKQLVSSAPVSVGRHGGCNVSIVSAE